MMKADACVVAIAWPGDSSPQLIDEGSASMRARLTCGAAKGSSFVGGGKEEWAIVTWFCFLFSIFKLNTVLKKKQVCRKQKTLIFPS